MGEDRCNKVIVVGGGAAGMMSAIFAARNGGSVILVEPNEKMGRKIYITGKGRCNVTNRCDREAFLNSVPRNGKFLYSAISRFSPVDVCAFFEKLGVPLKVERGNRVFPQSDKSSDIIDGLFFEMRRLGVEIRRDRVVDLLVKDGGVIGVVCGSGGRIFGNAVILATGGASYPRTGSTGDGYRLAQSVGHTISPIRGSLVPLESDDPHCWQMQGLSLRNVELKITGNKGKVVYREQGELLFTHFGLTGPLVLSASAHMDFLRGSYMAHVDLKPALDEQKLDARLVRDFEARSNQNYSTVLGGIIPQSMIPVMIERTGIPGEEKVRDLRREQRRRLLQELKDFRISLTGSRPVEEAIITSGGVKVSEVNPGTMESKKIRGLYFAGEILDVDAYTGGFNLQIAWSTGFTAGCSAVDLGSERGGFF